jgi:hypothetical protein
MRQALTLTMVVLLALAGGCNQDDRNGSVAAASKPAAEAAPAHELTPEQMGELGAQIRKQPDRAESLLTERGLTRESFEAQIRKITENPDASKRYAEAYRKASA